MIAWKSARALFVQVSVQPTLAAARRNVAASAAAAKKATSPLGTLRKRSGYSLSLCKKALAANSNDVDQAFAWLQEQAQAQGWDKANKLEGRNTTQGLVGVAVAANKSAAMVELNCETDFVAKNKQFLSLLTDVVAATLTSPSSPAAGENFARLDGPALGRIGHGGKTLADLVALNIGQIGENIAARRAVKIDAAAGDENSFVAGLTHPSAPINRPDFGYGRYGVLLSLRKTGPPADLPAGETIENVSRQLCQHIIGMNPKSVGNLADKSTWPKAEPEVAGPEKVPEEGGQQPEEEEQEENPYGDYDNLASDGALDMSEDELIHQPFLLDSDRRVRDVLVEAGVEVVDFVRFEVGQ